MCRSDYLLHVLLDLGEEPLLLLGAGVVQNQDHVPLQLLQQILGLLILAHFAVIGQRRGGGYTPHGSHHAPQRAAGQTRRGKQSDGGGPVFALGVETLNDVE